VKLEKQRMDASKLAMPEIRALCLYFFETEIPKGNQDLVVRAFVVHMEKSPGLMPVISALRMHLRL
jgi:hypothetical protein